MAPLPKNFQAVEFEPVFANLFEVMVQNTKGDFLNDYCMSFYAYEKVFFGKDGYVKLHYNINEKVNLFSQVKDIKNIEVSCHNKTGYVYLKQSFCVEYIGHSMAQNYNDENLLNICFHFKILDEEINWI